MAETVNQETNGAAQTGAEKTFTQAEMNAIITDRLAREREKYKDYDALKTKAQQYDAAQEAEKSDLQKAQEQAAALQAQVNALQAEKQVRQIREKIAADKKIPASLLTGDTEEACTQQADAILAFAGSRAGYPAVKDGGEVNAQGGGAPRDQFAEWGKTAFGL